MNKLTAKERIGLAKVYEQLEYRLSIIEKLPPAKRGLIIMIGDEHAADAKSAIEKVLGITNENN